MANRIHNQEIEKIYLDLEEGFKVKTKDETVELSRTIRIKIDKSSSVQKISCEDLSHKCKTPPGIKFFNKSYRKPDSESEGMVFINLILTIISILVTTLSIITVFF